MWVREDAEETGHQDARRKELRERERGRRSERGEGRKIKYKQNKQTETGLEDEVQ